MFLKCVFSEQRHCGKWPHLGEGKQSPRGGSGSLQPGLLAVRSITRCGVGRAGCVGSGCRVNFPCFSTGQSVGGNCVPEKCLEENPKGTQIWCSWERAEPSLGSLGTPLHPPPLPSAPGEALSSLISPCLELFRGVPFLRDFSSLSKPSISPKREAFGQRNNHGIVKVGKRPLR